MRGVALLAIAEAGIALGEYSPLEVKISVVGYGRAEKQPGADDGADRCCGSREPIESEDACDALAVAICHATRAGHGAAAVRSEGSFGMRCLVPLLFAAVLTASAGPSIFYSKSFPGSKPAYVQVTLDEAGNGEYKEAPDDDQPLKFHLTEGETHDVFDLAAKLDHFKRPLESHLKVAFMGTKTFRWEGGAEKSEVNWVILPAR